MLLMDGLVEGLHGGGSLELDNIVVGKETAVKAVFDGKITIMSEVDNEVFTGTDQLAGSQILGEEFGKALDLILGARMAGATAASMFMMMMVTAATAASALAAGMVMVAWLVPMAFLDLVSRFRLSKDERTEKGQNLQEENKQHSERRLREEPLRETLYM
jgi:hypothetical protein